MQVCVVNISFISGLHSQRVLIRPDPSFNFNPALSDSDDDTNDKERNIYNGGMQSLTCGRLTGSESMACIPSTLQYSTILEDDNDNSDPGLSSPNNLRRHTLGQQHLLKHQQERLHSQNTEVHQRFENFKNNSNYHLVSAT